MKIGDKVIHKTKNSWELNLGSGIIVGEEIFAWAKLHRWLVLLDDPSKWSGSAECPMKPATFFDCELEAYEPTY